MATPWDASWVSHAMGLLEGMPFVMPDDAVGVEIHGAEDFRRGVFKMGLELLPVDRAIAIAIHIAKMSIEPFRIRQGCGMVPMGRMRAGAKDHKQSPDDGEAKRVFHNAPECDS